MTLINLQPIFDFLGRFTGGPENALILLLALVKIGLILGHILGIVPFIIWLERKLIAWIQDRPGPNRVGPFGLLQGIVDGAKLMMKEDFIPAGADRSLYLMAPGLTLIAAFLGVCIVPFGPIIDGDLLFRAYRFFGLQGMWNADSQLALAVTNPNIGVLYVFAVASIGVYGITLAGWSSENKWSLLGGIRAAAQMISYEIPLSLSVIGVLLLAGSLNMYDIIDGQAGGFWNWNIFAQPVAFLIFVIAMFAETNRLPFDLAEGEAELTGGFHTEYSSMKFALFFLAEYANMITSAAVCATLFLGGYLLVPKEVAVTVLDAIFSAIAHSEAGIPYNIAFAEIVALLLAPAGLILKIVAFIVLFIVVRAIWPRMRYDQVMSLGWKVLIIASLANLLVTAIGVGVTTALGLKDIYGKLAIGAVTLVLFVIVDRLHYKRRAALLKSRYRNYGLTPATKISPAGA